MLRAHMLASRWTAGSTTITTPLCIQWLQYATPILPNIFRDALSPTQRHGRHYSGDRPRRSPLPRRQANPNLPPITAHDTILILPLSSRDPRLYYHTSILDSPQVPVKAHSLACSTVRGYTTIIASSSHPGNDSDKNNSNDLDSSNGSSPTSPAAGDPDTCCVSTEAPSEMFTRDPHLRPDQVAALEGFCTWICDVAQKRRKATSQDVHLMYCRLKEDNISEYLKPRAFQLLLDLFRTRTRQSDEWLNKVPGWVVSILEERRAAGATMSTEDYCCLLEIFSMVPEREDEVLKLLADSSDSLRDKPNIEGIETMQKLFRATISGYSRCFNVRGVTEVIKSMADGVQELTTAGMPELARRLETDMIMWEMVMRLYSTQRMRVEMVKLWVQLISKGIIPSLTIQRLVVSILAKHGRIDEAEAVMRIGRALGAGSKDLRVLQGGASYVVSWSMFSRILAQVSIISAANSIETPHTQPQAIYRRIVIESDLAFKQQHTDESTGRGDDDKSGSSSRKMRSMRVLGPLDPVIYSVIVSSAITYHRVDVAEELLKELKEAGEVPDTTTLGHLASIFMERRAIDEIHKIVDSVVLSRSKQGLSGVDRHSTELSAIHADIDILVPLLYFYVERGNVEKIRALFGDWSMAHEESVPVYEFGLALLKVYRGLKMSWKGIKLFEDVILEHGRAKVAQPRAEMPGNVREHDSLLTTRHCMVLLRAALDSNDLQKCVEVLALMRDHGINPSRAFLLKLMHGFLNTHSLDLFEIVYRYVRDTLKRPLSVALYTRWMQIMAHHGDAEGVRDALADMQWMGQVPAPHHYSILIQTLSARGFVDQAMDVVKQLHGINSPVRPTVDMYVSLIEACVISGQIERAEEQLEWLLEGYLLPPARIPTRAFNNVMIAHLYRGDGLSAARIYRRMLECGVKPNQYTYSMLMHAHAWEGDLDACKQLLADMVKQGIEPDAAIYTIIIAGYSLKNDLRGAEQTFRLMCRLRDRWEAHKYMEAAGRPSWKMRSALPVERLAVSEHDNPSQRREQGGDSQPETTDKDTSAAEDAMVAAAKTKVQQFVIDPVVYITMMQMYRNSRRLNRVIDMWSSLLADYPILRWDPRKASPSSGGNQEVGDWHLRPPVEPSEETIAYTADFHSRGIQVLLRAFRSAIRIDDYVNSPKRAVEFMCSPDMARSDVPLQEKHFLQTRRSQGGGTIGGYDGKENDLNDPKSAVRLLIRIWQRMEWVGFKFDNVHVNEYIACLIFTRNYDELIRVLKASRPSQSQSLSLTNAEREEEVMETMAENGDEGGEKRPSNLPRLSIFPQNTYLLLDRLRADEIIEQKRLRDKRRTQLNNQYSAAKGQYKDDNNEEERSRVLRIIELWSQHVTVGGLKLLQKRLP